MQLKDYSKAAESLGVSLQTVRKLVADGELRPIRLGRRVLFGPDDLDNLVERLRDPAATDAAVGDEGTPAR